ncbi:ATP-binding protein [Agilicoccus flavus]|uniref:ATP-binding protein n=1 Tax=Agilicoccus flavus TaxID=2775968 RepID=UPI001CF6FB2E|nr:SbcC/MukB-like Walker B domain-containing protein [Agilicoccus flavus]
MTDTLFDLAGAPGPTEDSVETPTRDGQWRLAEIQVANWGTFDGAIYRMPVARAGHLVTGPSGSGKSSLLDAIAAVLTPDRWLRFNEAAQGAGARVDQRSVVSYVRGAWSRTTDELEDRVVSAYLRTGATWSGIVLRYENGVDRPVSLCRLFFVKGTGTTSADVSDLYLLDRSAIDLRDLEPYARTGLETRKVKAAWPDAVVTSGGAHARFYARLRSLFGIPHEGALQLLHKTQSAKSLDSLDQLFRDYMLERPSTFALAESAVTQFGELRDAHDHVVQLRKQRDLLLELRAAADVFDRATGVAAAAGALADALGPYRTRRGLELTRAEIRGVVEDIAGRGLDAERAEQTAARAEEDLDRAQRRARDLGGAEAEHLQHRIRSARDAHEAAGRRWEELRRNLTRAGIAHAPTTSAQFAELLAQIDASPEAGAAGPTHEQLDRQAQARREAERIEGEITSLRRSGSTVPDRLVSLRAAIAEATRLPATGLPFAAELIDVRPEFADWAGAIERVLRPFALTLLVRSEHLPAVRRWVDAHRIPVRLVYEEVRADAPAPRPAGSEISLVHRVRVADGPFASWVSGQLSERFDVACVEHPDDLDAHARAVTIQGQIKARLRYEKDDRQRIDDRAHWVLGDREGKLEALIAQLRDATGELEAAGQVVERATRLRSEADYRRATLESIRGQSWTDLDRDAAQAEVERLAHTLAQLAAHDGDLGTAVREAEQARGARDAAARLREDARLALRQAQSRCDELTAEAESLDAEIASGAVPELDDATRTSLDQRFRAVQRRITRTSIADVAHDVMRRLQRERDTALETARESSGAVSTLATRFKERWPASSADLVPGVDDRHAYLEILDGIVAHGLPEHEATFLRLLRERSRDMIGELVSDILAAPREIEDRVGPVNASLRRSPFDDERWLRLRVKTRRSETVTRFIGDLRSIAEGGWGEDDLDAAERRFVTLAELMRRFASSEHVDRVWRTQCLDTRLHVTFLAEEIDEHGRAHATYDSGAAMSGGQQQKLVVFCLAAALRYQLADPDEPQPRYGTIVLDEAFDKADTRYTRMALDVFREFGFHLVLATPQKLLQTIEPYVGAATSIENPTRRRSQIANIAWEEAGT